MNEMITIQEFGTSVMNKDLKTLYIMCGCEYGVKHRYIQMISDIYNGRCIEYETLESVLDLMKVKRIIPLQPSLYIVRYDDSILQNGEKLAKRVSSTKIIGTVIVLFESESAAGKCGKWFPDNTVTFDSVDPKFVKRYLKNDYPNIPDNTIDSVLSITTKYADASNICNCLSYIEHDLALITDSDIRKTFTTNDVISIDNFKFGFAARDSAYCMRFLSSYTGQIDQVIYAALNALLEVEKCLSYKNAKSWASRYAKSWSINDIMSMFNNLYGILRESRSDSSYNTECALLCAIALMRFSA